MSDALQRVVLFGERPGPNTDPKRPLFPHTTTGAAAKLISLMGVSTEDYLALTSRFNVFDNGEHGLYLQQARERVNRIMTAALQAQGTDCRFVFVGAQALRAAPQFYRQMQFLDVKDLVLCLPHTSGVNRWYNSAENTVAARAALQSHIGGRAGPPVDAQAAAPGQSGAAVPGRASAGSDEAPAKPPSGD